MKRGLFIGRFQPFHLGHLQDIKNALEEVDELVIGVGSSNEKHTKENPFTVEERIGMIDLVLPNNDIRGYTVNPIPDFHDDKKWVDYVETVVPKFDIVYTGNKWTERCFKGKYKVKRVDMLKGVSSTIIRNRIITNKNWEELVPKDVVGYINGIKGVERVKRVKKIK
ncbi:MAG: nicotinamide-nucleotide adenylyltransferase [Candidatus Woesearchaeota archaeon]|jgi:nicotinamide-nucleotide adenylyltransferase|nr:nicotinamide-nucleotide adenylyltransferase [Candidatus Woesearchaeota archaeon]